MIWIVSGIPRSGTSMMMQALIAGGMSAAFDPDRDAHVAHFEDAHYKANPCGQFEIPWSDYQSAGFAATYDAQLVKVFHWGLVSLPPWEYRIVCMMRDPAEIQASANALLRPQQIDARWPDLEQQLCNTFERLGDRDDMDLVCCDYAATIQDPVLAFAQLRDRGWPLDPVRAAAVVDPAWYRFRNQVTHG